MNRRHISPILAAMSSVGLLLPAPLWSQESEPKTRRETAQRRSATEVEQKTQKELAPAKPKKDPVRDLVLTKDGQLEGSILSAKGEPMDGAEIVLRRGETEVSKSISDAEGHFQMTGLKGGVYTLVSPQGPRAVRLWTADVAPPNALGQMQIVADEAVVRGQFGYLDPANSAALLLGVTSATLSGVAVADLQQQKKQLNAIQSSVTKQNTP